MEITSFGQLLLGVLSIISTVGVVGQAASVVADTAEPPAEVLEAEAPAGPKVEDVVPVEPTPTPEPEPETAPEPTASTAQMPATTPKPSTLSPTTQAIRAELKGLTEAEIGRPVVLAPGTVVQEEDKGRIMTAWDYVLTWSGVCPSQQVKSVFWQAWSKNAALGAWSQHPSVEYYIDQACGLHNGGMLPENVLRSPLYTIEGIPSNTQTQHVLLEVNHLTRKVSLTVNFKDEEKYLENPAPEWETLVARGQAYMDNLYARYAVLCPND